MPLNHWSHRTASNLHSDDRNSCYLKSFAENEFDINHKMWIRDEELVKIFNLVIWTSLARQNNTNPRNAILLARTCKIVECATCIKNSYHAMSNLCS